MLSSLFQSFWSSDGTSRIKYLQPGQLVQGPVSCYKLRHTESNTNFALFGDIHLDLNQNKHNILKQHDSSRLSQCNNHFNITPLFKFE